MHRNRVRAPVKTPQNLFRDCKNKQESHGTVLKDLQVQQTPSRVTTSALMFILNKGLRSEVTRTATTLNMAVGRSGASTSRTGPVRSAGHHHQVVFWWTCAPAHHEAVFAVRRLVVR